MASEVVNELYTKINDGTFGTVSGFTSNFAEEERNAFVRVNYTITSYGGVRDHFNWLLTRGQTSVRPPQQLASWEVLPFTFEDLTGISESSFEVGDFELPTLPVTSQPQPETSTPPRVSVDPTETISIDGTQLTPFTDRVDINPFIFIGDREFIVTPLPLDIVGGSPISGEGGRENPQLGSSTSRGGVLGGANYSNPQTAIENEWRYRTRITNRER
jgi:hypothetical protein